jgi:chromosome segregation ATPase
MKRLTAELNKKQQECERNLSSAVKENAKQQEEINELKHEITNYEAIVADNNNLNRQLQDELAKCQGSKLHKLGSSVRQNTGPTSSDRQNPGPTSSDRQNTGPTSTVRQNSGLTSSSVRRSVKSGSRRSSNLMKPKPGVKHNQ